ncbi:MAG TPA: putative peptidoglycan glycosyltransferase FtsW [Anaerolineales bacterium]
MGNGTRVMTGRGMARHMKAIGGTARRSVRLGIDVPLLLAVITLIVFGLLMVYSASWDYSLVTLGQAPTYMFTRQLMWLGIGSIIAILMTWFDYHRWQKLAIPLMGLTIAGLILVLFVNEVINNASRTILGGSGQPSELAKLVIILYLAVWLYAKRDQLSDVSFGLVPLGMILGLLGGLIFLQPDLSAAATIFILGGMLFFLAGGDLRQIAFILVLGLIVGWLVFRFHPTGSQRVAEYMLSIKDLTNAPMHLSRSLEALVKGGWFGVGIGRADTKLTGLPVPPTDSIFAVVGEEVGIIGASMVVGLFALLMWRGLKIANRAPDGLGKLLAAGLSLWIAMEAFINMAVIVGLVPFAGNALPFISAGGSNLVVSLAAVGILMNISRLSAQSKDEEERAFDAVIDLRRRDWRWRVSRPRGTEGARKR